MEKNGEAMLFYWRSGIKKMILLMKLICVLFFIGLIQVHASTYGQSEEVSFSEKRLTIDEIFSTITTQLKYDIFYSDDEINVKQVVGLPELTMSVESVLQKILGNKFVYTFVGKTIVIAPSHAGPQVKEIKIVGKVMDEKKEPLPGVTVLMKGTTLGVATDVEGNFTLTLLKRDTMTLVFTFVGMETQYVKISKWKDGEEKKELKIVMKEEKVALEDVVVTGYANVKKSSFTGSATTVTRDELKNVTSGNIIAALQVFDPSLRVIKNNLMGSDPNTLPEFYVRGRSGMDGVRQLDQMTALESGDVSKYALTNNPNTPIFIMDGYEVSVEKVYDLDLNRVSSVTILKDAAATAIYGSRASNGVVVIETVAPQPGKLRISYYFNGSITAPDLSDYDMMNAREKLDAEVAAGLLDPTKTNYTTNVANFRAKENNVLLGIDTYWLSQPLETQFNHKHTLNVEGGVESIRFALSLNYDGQNGVMKESYRRRVGGDFKVDYRIHGVQFYNQVSYNMTKSQNSPYGSFSDYSQQQPYVSPWDLETGECTKTLPWSSGTGLNPLYEATLGNYSRSDYKQFADNLTVNMFFLRNFQLKAQVAIDYKEDKGKTFVDPNSSKYYMQTVSPFDRGELRTTNKETFEWNTNVLLIYTSTIGNHNMNFSLGLNARETKARYTTSSFKGFPSAQLSDQKYAKTIVDTPDVQDNNTRLVGTFLFANYTWKDLYLADVSVRLDGSSEFGEDNRFATFWSFGLGVNLHKYEFMKAQTWLKALKIKANYGETGKVNFPPYAATNTYKILLDNWHLTGIGGVLTYMGNDKLKWEKTSTWNIGLELNILARLNLNVNWYDKRTKDLITDVTIPSSSGFTSYKDNMGEVLNRGWEVDLNYAILKKKDWDINLFCRAAHNKNEILKISDTQRDYNERVNAFYDSYGPYLMANKDTKYATPILQYVEGGSLTSIFGMKSLGIATANGQELFMNRDGSVTYTWNSREQVILGNTEPDIQGSFGFNLRYGAFTLYTTFLFETGAEAYNSTLVNNVENVDLSKKNADRRVMTMRWQKPGDEARLKSITDSELVTRPTSRFVQENNNVTFNSLSLAYDFNPHWIAKFGLSVLKLQFSMNDVAVISSIKQERGLSYPFARTFNFGLTANF